MKPGNRDINIYILYSYYICYQFRNHFGFEIAQIKDKKDKTIHSMYVIEMKPQNNR